MTGKKKRTIILAIAAVLLALVVWTVWGNTALELNTYTVGSKELPDAFDGYRTLRIVVPAGSQDDFVYSDEEVSTTGNSIVIWSGEGLDDTEVLLFPVDEATETG